MARRGTEAFPNLGAHCDEPDCNQLDFLPFDCDGCGKVFCAAHRSYRDHGCAKAADQGRTVVVCPDCGDAIERLVPGQDEREILAAHARSRRCDPAKKRKPRCPARRCKEQLTFSNTHDCKGCGRKVCLKHRFPADHDCAARARAAAGAAAAARRAGGECGRGAREEGSGGWALPASIRSLRIF
jgi:predicted nucleic acid binding AN1-type Zn finger protein